MKLDHVFGSAFFRRAPRAAGLVAVAGLACACSTAVSAPKSACAEANASATTSLMSAQIAGPAPKVGKAHLSIDTQARTHDEAAPLPLSSEGMMKDVRPSDGSRRGGGFGVSSK